MVGRAAGHVTRRSCPSGPDPPSRRSDFRPPQAVAHEDERRSTSARVDAQRDVRVFAERRAARGFRRDDPARGGLDDFPRLELDRLQEASVPAGSSPAFLNSPSRIPQPRWPALPVLRPSMPSLASASTCDHHLSPAVGAPPQPLRSSRSSVDSRARARPGARTPSLQMSRWSVSSRARARRSGATPGRRGARAGMKTLALGSRRRSIYRRRDLDRGEAGRRHAEQRKPSTHQILPLRRWIEYRATKEDSVQEKLRRNRSRASRRDRFHNFPVSVEKLDLRGAVLVHAEQQSRLAAAVRQRELRRARLILSDERPRPAAERT